MSTVAGNGHAAESPPVAVVFECAEDPVPGSVVFDQPDSALICVRTWGHMIDSGVLSSIEYAVGTYDLPLVIVLGHTDCSALTAGDVSAPVGAAVRNVPRVLEQIGLESVLAGGTAVPEAVHLREVCEALVQRSPLLTARVAAGECAVAGVLRDGTGRAHLSVSVGDVGELAMADNLAR